MGINGKGSVLAFSSGLDQQRRGGFGLVSYISFAEMDCDLLTLMEPSVCPRPRIIEYS